MAENYIHIYTSYLSDLYADRRLTFAQTYDLLRFFETEARQIASREQLIKFLDKYLLPFPQLVELKRRLTDETFVFPEPPAESD